ncbi:MAG: hypothetical protein A3K19_22660 [Lentisphaerae bacterium RIFOXYB12_FULL_65_16]|nr:MAG: hypothetical protein A3K18_17095 [Lentisphaerae bacterium RIFOXYA12_64_32]OGV90086.1 MAG: hypothetical protein A3K19_22660 [Lentisphaerae bacterium RIFOXYB12_FULL_65_16]
MAIQGLGPVGGFGSGTAALERALVTAASCPHLTPVPSFSADTAGLEAFVERKTLRRMDHFSRMAMLGAFLALEDAGRLTAGRERLGLVLASGYGAARTTFAFLDSSMDHGDVCASPTSFSTSVHNAAAANIAIVLDLHGPTITVSQFELSVPSALLTAGQWLTAGRVDAVLFGSVDEFCPVIEYGLQRLHADQNPPPPQSSPGGTVPPGEGAVFFLLTRVGEESRYGVITDIRLGTVANGEPRIATDAVVVVNDQRGAMDADTTAPVPAPAPPRAVSYTPVYGRLPVGPAFDMAIAALACRHGLTAATRNHAEPAAHPIPPPSHLLNAPSITCLVLGRDNTFGLITSSGRG